MSVNHIISSLDALKSSAEEILELLKSRRTGHHIASLTRELPELDLTDFDIDNIFKKLNDMGVLIQKIISDSRKKYDSFEIIELTQALVDNHTATLQIILSLQQNQMDRTDSGLMIQSMIGFHNVILNLRTYIITNDSYITTPSGGSLSGANRKNLVIILGIIGILAPVGGYSLYTYSINIDIGNSPQISGDISITNSEQIIANSGFGSIIVHNNSFDFKEDTPKIVENGLIYRNETLGFEIARPNLTWYFDPDMSQLKIERTGTITEKEFLGGLYVGTSTNENVFVSVFDITEMNKDSLEGYVDAQIQWVMENSDAELKLRDISPNMRWAIFGIEVKINDEILYGEQILEIRNDRLYMLQYTGDLPEKIQPEKRKEFRTIIDSFKPFP